MTIIDGCVYITYFLICQYVIEKRKFPSVLEFLDSITFGKLLIASLAVIGLCTSLSMLVHFMTYPTVLVTIFMASYLCFRYRQSIEKRYKS